MASDDDAGDRGADRRSRRQVLSAIGAGLTAGCAGLTGGSRSPAAADTPTVTPVPATDAADTGDTTDSIAETGIPPDICSESVKSDPGIYAVDDPTVAADWRGRDIDPRYRAEGVAGLAPDQTVVGLTADGAARAYPLSVLWYHEVVNDEFGGPVLVTYCPLCRSGVVAERRVGGASTTFGVSGLLWQPERIRQEASEQADRVFGADRSGETDPSHNGNLVMYDQATRSYWSQILARAICGPETGTELSIRASTVTTWTAWRDDHPDTDVLLPPPHSGVLETND